MTDHIQIEDTSEFAVYESTIDDRRGASPGAPGALWSWSGRGRFAGGCRESRPDWMIARDMANDMFGAVCDREIELESNRNRSAAVDLDAADAILFAEADEWVRRANANCARIANDYSTDEWNSSKIGILSDEQWAHMCAALNTDPS